MKPSHAENRKTAGPGHKRPFGTVGCLWAAILSMVLCALCLCSATWAWFTASVGSGISPVSSGNTRFAVSYRAAGDSAATAVELADRKSKYASDPLRLSAGTRYELSAGVTENSVSGGFLLVKIGETEYAGRVLPGQTVSFSVTPTADTEISFTGYWGTTVEHSAAHSLDELLGAD